ncbi:polysaccharide biosynthesis protein [Nocardioides sp.]|uniref:polysaccharide biosynthesis protein n=1 Tax=Nocardioides sp. TaxID=35761 RepID=UPI0039E49858
MTIESESRPTSRLRQLLAGGGVIALAIVAMNVSVYAFQMVAARLLGPEQYGGVASLLGTLLVVSVLQLGLQATAARRIAAEPTDVGRVEHDILRISYRASIVLAAALLVLSPVVERMLRLDSVYPALLLAVGTVPMTVMGAQAGILQGERRWIPLALVYLAAGVPRLVLGIVAMAIRPTEGAAMAAVALGWFAPVVVGWLALRRSPVRTAHQSGDLAPMLREIWHGSMALLGFFALSNADIVLSRNVLGNRESGLYAGGLILTKAVLFLPQFVAVVAFPAMSTTAGRRRALLRSLGLVGICGVVCVAGAVLLNSIAMIFIGGDDYRAIEDRLWLFAVLGTLLSALQLLVYSVLARQSRGSAYLLWVGVAVVIVVGLRLEHLTALLTLVTIVDAVLLAALLGLSLWRMQDDPRAAEETPG